MANERLPLLQGTLDLLILQTLTEGAMHGYAIVRQIEERTDDVIFVEEGTLYPALHRLAKRGWVRAKWGRSENNRRARFYGLTAQGRRQLVTETEQWHRFRDAVGKVLSPSPSAR